ncbi:hypothetical protein ES705_35752 [subsurface metagenome]
MPQRQHTLLFLSGGSLVGLNVLSCLHGRHNNLRLVTTNSIAEDPGIFEYDRIYLTPPTQGCSDEYLNSLNEIISKENPDLVIPCRDEDVLAVALMRENVSADQENRFLGGNVDIAQVLLNKQKSWEFSHQHNLPFATTLASEATKEEILEFAELHGYPIIAKPKEGFASKGVYLIINEEQLLNTTASAKVMLQEYLGDANRILEYQQQLKTNGVPLFYSFEGLKHSIQVFISKTGEVKQIFLTFNKMAFGKSEKVWITQDPEVEAIGALCGKVFAENGWKGPLNIQCEKAPDGRVRIYEYNGRFTGATGARYLLGNDEVGAFLKDFANINLPDGKVGNRHEVIRIPKSYATDLDNSEKLKKDGFFDAF